MVGAGLGESRNWRSVKRRRSQLGGPVNRSTPDPHLTRI